MRSTSRPDPVVSIIIATRDRLVSLERTLRCVSRMAPRHATCELVIVDNGSTDATGAIARLAADLLDGWDVTIVREPVAGNGTARNTGLRAARGRYIAITDDDCYPRPDFADRIVERFARRDDLGFLAGRILLFDPSDAPVAIRFETEEEFLAPCSFVPSGFIAGANMAFRRDLVQQAGGFDSRLGAGTPFSCEDLELAARVSWLGHAGVFDPAVVVDHHHGRKPGPAAQRVSDQYDIGRGAYYAIFLSDPRSRRQYARHFYWSLCRDRRARRFAKMRRELRGAVRFWRRHGLRPKWPLSAENSPSVLR